MTVLVDGLHTYSQLFHLKLKYMYYEVYCVCDGGLTVSLWFMRVSQGHIVYEIRGVYPSPSFFQVVPQSNGVGRISITRDLRTDNLQLSSYLLNMVAYDNANPIMEAKATVRINVKRNQNGPVFQPSSTYEKTLAESFEVGEVVLKIKAVDQDTNVSWHFNFLRYVIISNLLTKTESREIHSPFTIYLAHSFSLKLASRFVRYNLIDEGGIYVIAIKWES